MVARSPRTGAARKGEHSTRARSRSARAATVEREATRAREAAPEREPQQRAGPRPFWSGTISFGLVSVPVNLFGAVRGERLALRMLGSDGTPLQRRYFCPDDEKDVPYDELVRGYEVAPDEHVVITDEELEALAPRASRDIDLRRFVPLDEVDPFLFESSYVLAPAGDSVKAYRLLAQVMESEGRAGIATFVLRERSYLVAILARGGVLHAETLRYADEVRTPGDAGLADPGKKAPPQELVAKFARAIERAPSKLAPSELADEETEELRAFVAKKLAQRADVVEARDVAPEADEGGGADPTDLLAALKRSLSGGRSARGRAAPGRRAPRRAKAGAKPRRPRA